MLQILAVLHYVLAGLTLFCGLVPAVIMLLVTVFTVDIVGVYEIFYWVEVFSLSAVLAVGLIVGIIMVLLIGLPLLLLISGDCIRQRKGYWFSLVLGCLLLPCTPLGTALGIFTLVVLCRTSVRQLYGLEIADS
jgi:hypothetical protein